MSERYQREAGRILVAGVYYAAMLWAATSGARVLIMATALSVAAILLAQLLGRMSILTTQSWED